MSNMTEEEKAALAAKEKEEFEASLEGLSEEEKAQKIAEKEALSKNNTDIENALKAERERREEAERKLEETRRKAKERWEEAEKKRKEEGIDDEDKPLTKRELEEMFQERDERIRKESFEIKAFEEARKLAESDSEAQLIVEVWKNRNLPGSFQEQIQEAQSIALGKIILKRNAELKRALAAKDGESSDGSNAQRQPMQGSEPKLNPQDKTAVSGMIWDSARGAYKKTIAGGKKIFYVSRDLKKRWIENAK